MKRIVLFLSVLAIPLMLTVAAHSVKYQGRSVIDTKVGLPFVVDEYSTDGINGPIVYSKYHIENEVLNYLFYLVITVLVVKLAIRQTKSKAKTT